MIFANIKNPGDVETKKYIAFAPFARGLGNEVAFGHTNGIGKM